MAKENQPSLSPKQSSESVDKLLIGQPSYYPDTFFQQVLELSPLPISAVDFSGKVLFASKHHLKFRSPGRSAQSIVVESDLYPEDIYLKLRQDIYPKLLKGESVQWSAVVQHSDDVKRNYRFSHCICCDLVTEKQIVFTSGVDITETNLVEKVLSEYRGQAHSATFLDPLTGLANRSLFYDRIHRSLSRVNRGNGHLALLLLDLDNFANLNEEFGHDFGDLFLKKCAQRIVDALRDADSVARLSGDKFVIVLETVDNVADIEAIADKLLDLVGQPLIINEQPLKISMSIGISLYPEHGLTVDQLLLQADLAMYQAKADGRNTFRFYDEGLNDSKKNTVLFENELHRALTNNELRLYYQPQVSLIDSRITGLEALIRWQHPERGLLSPAHFVPLAEESGLIEPIGLWIIEEAAKQFKSWLSQGFDFGRVAVNLSLRQIREQSFVERLTEALLKTNLEARYIELEVTESSAMENAAETIATLNTLSALGFSLSVDDFGTGYSSLSYLKRFSLTKVKIDRSFLDDIDSVDYDATIAKSIIHLAHEMSLDILAEGIEREVQSQWLLKHGCYLAQGYFYSKPLSEKELMMLAKGSNQSGGTVFLKR